MNDVSRFYDEISGFYHLIYPNWDSSMAKQASDLDSIVRDYWGEGTNSVLDASCGIGTQAIGLAQRGYEVTASDLSPAAIRRAREEASRRGLNIEFTLADMRTAFDSHRRTFDVVIACDNSLPHLLTDSDILAALRQFHACTSPGGGCIVSVRDYASMDLQGTQFHPFGVRVEGDRRYVVFQVWEFQGLIYDLNMYFIEDDPRGECKTFVSRSKYYAITTKRLLELMAEAGYRRAIRLDDRYFQPVLIGTKSE